jgi:hypothetical protein
VDADFYKAQLKDSAPEAQNTDGSGYLQWEEWDDEDPWGQLRPVNARQLLLAAHEPRASGRGFLEERARLGTARRPEPLRDAQSGEENYGRALRMGAHAAAGL